MPESVGYLGEEKHDKLITELVEQETHYLTALRRTFQQMVSDHRLYLGYRQDRRKVHEKWRAFSQLGDPARLTDTETQSWLEILTSVDPPIQVEGRATEDEWKARGFERYAGYFLNGVSWPYQQEMVLRNLSIQGWKILQTGWKEISYAPMRRPSKEEMIQFDSAVNDGLKRGQIESPPDPESQPDEFRSWLDSTRAVFPQFPEPPGLMQDKVTSYRGPWISRPAEFDFRFDPFTEDWAEQEIVFQRVIKPRTWGEKQVELGKFDEKQFAGAVRKAPDDNRLSEWDRQIAEEIGLVWDPDDPRFKNSDEYWVVWRQFDETAPFLVVLNRSAVVNVSTEWPHWHRQLPFVCIRNTPMERRAFGLGSYHQVRRTFEDRNVFRDLLLDALILHAMPVVFKTRNFGMPELQRFLSPGAMIDVNDVNGIRLGWGESMSGFAELMRVGEMLLNDQNALLGTWEHVQGQQANIGRVSATEASERLQQALIKHKKKAERIEQEQSRIWPQVFYNAYQHYGLTDPELTELRRQIVGEDEQDPLGAQDFTVATFAEDLAKTVKFHGATNKINKELHAQQLKDFIATFSQIASATNPPVPIMSPMELRALMRRAYEVVGQKGAPEVFTQEGDAAVKKALEAHLLQAEAAPLSAQVQTMQLQLQGVMTQMQLMQAAQPQIPANVPGNGAPEGAPEVPPEEVPPEAPLEGEVVQ